MRAILWATAHYGFPVSTTQTISGSVIGAGAIRGFSAVRWGVAGNILVAWVLTIPMAALVGAGMELVTRVPAGDLIVFLLAGLIAAAAFVGRRWETRRLTPAHASNDEGRPGGRSSRQAGRVEGKLSSCRPPSRRGRSWSSPA